MKEMKTDLTPMKTRSLRGRLRITEFQRLRAGDWADVAPITEPVPALPDQTVLLLAAVRDRFPIEGLSIEVNADRGATVTAAPIGLVHFPEQSTHLPDPVLEQPTCDVAANTTQTFLLKIELPADAEVGTCNVTVTARSRSHGEAVEAVRIDIGSVPHLAARDPRPAPRINFWPHWTSFCRYYKLELWSEPFWHMAQRYLREMAAGGANVVTANIVEDPFRYPLPPELYHFNHFPGMVGWVRRRDGRFGFDYAVYDRYVEANFAAGIDQEIECHAMLPCKMQKPWLDYFDEVAGKRVQVETSHDAPDYREAWSQFFASFTEHNRRRGWLEKLTLCIYDEPQDEHSFRSAAQLARRCAPDLRITAAIPPQVALRLTDVLDIATLNAGEFSAEAAAQLRAAGLEVRWYNCCHPAWANTLFVSPLSDAYRLAWITAAQQLGGYLRWSIVDWTDDPWRDPAFNWPTGDTCLLYPGERGPATSLRWDAYKLGLADLRLLHAARAAAAPASRAQLDAHLHEVGAMAPTPSPTCIARWRRRLHALVHQAGGAGARSDLTTRG